MSFSAAFVPQGDNPGEFDDKHWLKELGVVMKFIFFVSVLKFLTAIQLQELHNSISRDKLRTHVCEF